MKQKLLIGIAVGTALIGAAWFGYQRFGTLASIEISQAEIQSRLETQFPFQKCFIVCLILSEPKVSLNEGSDRIHFVTNLMLESGQRKMPGQMSFSGKLRYEREAGKFFFDAIEVQDLNLAGIPPEFAEIVKVRGPGIAAAMLSDRPIYTLDNNTLKGSMARLAIKDVKVVGGKLRVSFLATGS